MAGITGQAGTGQNPYPVQFSVDYPDRPLNRLTTFFRIFAVIPIAIVLGAVSGATWQWIERHRDVRRGGRRRLAVFRPRC